MNRISITVGLPGSGKSTYLTRIGAHPVSSDSIRELLADDARDQSIHDRVFATIRYLVRHRIELGRPVSYIDATNLTKKERAHWIEFAKENGCTAEALFFDTPLEVCLRRNRERTRRVPEEVIMEMSKKLMVPSIDEGFTRVEVIRT